VKLPDVNLHGAEVCSADTDFGRFCGFRWTNPLA
jgi:hypothetical protein